MVLLAARHRTPVAAVPPPRGAAQRPRSREPGCGGCEWIPSDRSQPQAPAGRSRAPPAPHLAARPAAAAVHSRAASLQPERPARARSCSASRNIRRHRRATIPWLQAPSELSGAQQCVSWSIRDLKQGRNRSLRGNLGVRGGLCGRRREANRFDVAATTVDRAESRKDKSSPAPASAERNLRDNRPMLQTRNGLFATTRSGGKRASRWAE
jgi:hypothetical protein